MIYLGTRYAYLKLKDLSERFASALVDIGVRPGQRVILYIPNGIQWVVSWLGIQRADAVCVPITPIYTPHDLRYIANDSEAEAIVCADTNFGYVKNVLPIPVSKPSLSQKWPISFRPGSGISDFCLT